MLRLMAPGPGNWIMPRDLFHLGDGYFHPFSFSNLELLALASKLRVIEFEQLDLDRPAAELCKTSYDMIRPLYDLI